MSEDGLRPAGEGTWVVFAFWGQLACHKIWDRFYVIDHLSRAGAQASVAWWLDAPLPALGDAGEVVESFFCDSLEWKASMDWTRGFAEAFRERFGYDLLRYLSVVGEARTYPKGDVPSYAFADEGLTRAVRRGLLRGVRGRMGAGPVGFMSSRQATSSEPVSWSASLLAKTARAWISQNSIAATSMVATRGWGERGTG